MVLGNKNNEKHWKLILDKFGWLLILYFILKNRAWAKVRIFILLTPWLWQVTAAGVRIHIMLVLWRDAVWESCGWRYLDLSVESRSSNGWRLWHSLQFLMEQHWLLVLFSLHPWSPNSYSSTHFLWIAFSEDWQRWEWTLDSLFLCFHGQGWSDGSFSKMLLPRLPITKGQGHCTTYC